MAQKHNLVIEIETHSQYGSSIAESLDILKRTKARDL